MEVDGDEPARNKELSMKCVALANRVDLMNVPSMLQQCVEKKGHTLVLSPKYHAELAGHGIEYDFGVCKHHLRSHPRHSKKGLLDNPLMTFRKEVVSLSRARRNARKASGLSTYLSWHPANYCI